MIPILARGDGWVVVAKPPRLLVHRTPMARRDRVFALQLVRDQLGTHVYPVSRLDRAASGCLPFALSSSAARMLHDAMRADTAEKTYLAMVRGRWTHGDGIVVSDRPMKDDNGRLKDALTRVECLGTTGEPRSSLVRAWPKTGRFHQVRRHLRDLSHPILADRQHGDNKANRWWQAEHGVDRLTLHCARLDVPLPDGTRLTAACPLFEDLHRWWSAMPWWDEARRAEPLLDESPLPLPDVGDVRRVTDPAR